jgi:hypothetical protein
MRAVGELGRVHRSPRPVCSPSRHRATARCHRDAGPGPAAADDKASSPASEDDAALSADAGRHPLARRGAMLALVAASTAASAARPMPCSAECGLAKFSVNHGSIAATTRGSKGVVAWLSR